MLLVVRALCSEKLDVDDHYIAWRQSHDSPATEYIDGEGPFSFCSYPFLLNPRAKSKLLHTEAKFMMNHTVQQVTARTLPILLSFNHQHWQRNAGLPFQVHDAFAIDSCSVEHIACVTTPLIGNTGDMQHAQQARSLLLCAASGVSQISRCGWQARVEQLHSPIRNRRASENDRVVPSSEAKVKLRVVSPAQAAADLQLRERRDQR